MEVQGFQETMEFMSIHLAKSVKRLLIMFIAGGDPESQDSWIQESVNARKLVEETFDKFEQKGEFVLVFAKLGTKSEIEDNRDLELNMVPTLVGSLNSDCFQGKFNEAPKLEGTECLNQEKLVDFLKQRLKDINETKYEEDDDTGCSVM